MKTKAVAPPSLPIAKPRPAQITSPSTASSTSTTWKPKEQIASTAKVSAAALNEKVTALNSALARGDASRALSLLSGGTVESNASLSNAYRLKIGRDLEYDMRVFPVAFKGLSANAMKQGFAALHQPRIEQNASRIAELSKTPTPAARAEVYRMLSLAGGEERTLLDAALKQKTGKDLGDTLRPIVEASINDKTPIVSDPQKTIAIVVSSGNLKDVVAGKTDTQVGGYHWREVEGYVTEALSKGFTPVIFTADGLPPSPDSLGLLQGQLGPKVGLGLRAGTGPESASGQVIM
jgi:hypothetical protein